MIKILMFLAASAITLITVCNINAENNDVELPPVSVSLQKNNGSSFNIGIKYGDWFDVSRQRCVPVKVYYPIGAKHLCPVILFSHGLGGSYDKCEYLGKTWAAAGFVSVHVQHRGCDDSEWKNKIRPFKELKDIYQKYWTGRVQAQDLKFVLDQLEIFVQIDPVFGKTLDLNRIGAAGYDLGGLASLLLAGQLPPDHGDYLYDARIKAVVIMSPPVTETSYTASSVYETVQVPAMFFTGTEDNGVVGTTKAFQRRIPFDHLVNADRYLVTYQGSDHMIYSGHFLSVNGRNDNQFQQNIAQTSLLFWNAYLADDAEAAQRILGNTLGEIVAGLGRIERKIAPTIVPLVVERQDTTSY